MRGLNLVVLRCRDVERSRAFYELMGMKFEKHRHGNGPEHYAYEDERGVFELYPAKGELGDMTGLGFEAENLEVLAGHLKEKGFEPSAPAENPWGRTFVVKDPDGRRVEVKQRA